MYAPLFLVGGGALCTGVALGLFDQYIPWLSAPGRKVRAAFGAAAAALVFAALFAFIRGGGAKRTRRVVTNGEPSWFALAQSLKGLEERPGRSDNPKVVELYADSGNPGIKHDSVPWCAAFVGAILWRTIGQRSGSLMARSYHTWGKKCKPKKGCVVVLWRGKPDGSAGHVGFLVKHSKNYVWLLGGNQADAVNVTRFLKSRVLKNGYRWPRKLSQSRTMRANVAGLAVGAVSVTAIVGELSGFIQPLQFLGQYWQPALIIAGTIPLVIHSVTLALRVADWYRKGRT